MACLSWSRCLGWLPCFPRSRRPKSSASESSHLPTAAPLPHQQLPGHHNHEPQISSSFHDQAQRIAQIPVGGIRRNPGPSQTSSFISSYQPVQNKGPYAPGTGPPNARDGRVGTFDTDITEDTLVGSSVDVEKKVDYGPDVNKSTWKGKPNGTAYDRREELTEEDEDMWARMAM